MANLITAFSSQQKSISIEACTVDLPFLRQFYQEMYKATAEAQKIQVSELVRLESTTPEQFEKFKEEVKSHYVLIIQIWGSRGEYLHSPNIDILNEDQLPNEVTRIIFDSSLQFVQNFKVEPSHKVKIEFDFSRARVFDLVSPASQPTPNTSAITVVGTNVTWVSGTYSTIIDLIEGRKRRVNWLHGTNIYDIFLWTSILPIGFWALAKLDLPNRISWEGIPQVYFVGVNIYLFLFFCLCCRILFNYARWIFPKHELVYKDRKSSAKHRYILWAVLGPLIVSFIGDIVRALYTIIF